MKLPFAAVGLALMASLGMVNAQTITERMTPLYSSISPKLRIQTTSAMFQGVMPGDISLEFMPKIDSSHYDVVISSDAILSVTLKSGNKWGNPSSASGQTLYLTALKINGENKMTEDAATVAMLLPTPTVTRVMDTIYMTASRSFVINGTNFNAKSMDLRFDPPLKKDDDYILTVKSSTSMILTRRTGVKWRGDGEPGPLKLTFINTGAGFLRIDPKFGGVTVAEVQADLGAHGVTVADSPEERFYQNTGKVTIYGTGFNTSHNTLRFANGLRGKGVNYTAVKHTDTQLVLDLTKGSLWRQNPKNLPGPLVLLAVDAGAGFVPVGPTEAKKGRTVATIFEIPTVAASSAKIYNMHTHEIWVQGTGFTKGTYNTEMAFDPPLEVGTDVSLKVYNRTTLRIQLNDGKSWSTFGSGLREQLDLKIVTINTGAGPVEVNVKIAEIQADEKAHASVRVDRSSQMLYQSTQGYPLVISGAGFTRDTKLVFSPELIKDEDYSQTFVGSDRLELLLKPSKLWHFMGGTLLVTGLDIGNGEGVIAVGSGGTGLQVAEILIDPYVEQSERIIFASHSPKLAIRGDGFEYGETTIRLDPTPPDAYIIASVEPTEIELRLNPGYSWVDGLLDGESKHLRVTAIDCGAGELHMSGQGIVVAKVEPDIDDNNCDDSCEWAMDGICDDGSADSQDFFDDDYGGLYGYDDYYGQYAYFDDYGEGDDAYGAMDDDFFLGNVCEPGTDCTDCGGPAHPTQDQYSPYADAAVECDNTCEWARDGFCDDARSTGLCKLGTDCADCGPVGASNFTNWEDDDGWWDDEDDSYWVIDDGLEYETEADENTKMNDGAGGAFIASLEVLVYLVGLVVCSGGIYIAVQWYNNRPVPFIEEIVKAQEQDDEEAFRKKKMSAIPITPDVTHT